MKRNHSIGQRGDWREREEAVVLVTPRQQQRGREKSERIRSLLAWCELRASSSVCFLDSKDKFHGQIPGQVERLAFTWVEWESKSKRKGWREKERGMEKGIKWWGLGSSLTCGCIVLALVSLFRMRLLCHTKVDSTASQILTSFRLSLSLSLSPCLHHLVAMGNLELHPVSELDDCLGKWDDCCELRMHLSSSLRYILSPLALLLSLSLSFSLHLLACSLCAIQLRTQDTQSSTRQLQETWCNCTWTLEYRKEGKREDSRNGKRERDIAKSVSRGALVHHM